MLPSALGPRVQLQLREHKALGTVAFYVSFKSFETGEWRRRSFSYTRWGFCEGIGDFFYLGSQLLELTVTPTAEEPRFSLLNFSHPPVSNIEGDYLGCGHDQRIQRNGLVPSWSEFLKGKASFDINMVIGFLFGDEPSVVKMFPSDAFEHRSRVKELLVRPNTNRHDARSFVTGKKWVVRQAGQITYSRTNSERKAFTIHSDSEYHEGLKAHHLLVVEEARLPLDKLFALNDDKGDYFVYTSRSSRFGDPSLPKNGPRHGCFGLLPDIVVDGRISATLQRLKAAVDDLIISHDAFSICLDWLEYHELHTRHDQQFGKHLLA